MLVPTPKIPANVLVAVLEVAVKYEELRLSSMIALPATAKGTPGVLVPIPNLLLVLSQTKVSSYERLPAAVQKAALLAAPLPVRFEPPIHVPFTAKHPALRLSPLAKVEVAPVR